MAMIRYLAELAADALLILRDIGTKKGKTLIDDSIFSIIPVSEDVFTEIGNKDRISFKPFYTSIREKFQTQELFWTPSGYIKGKDGYWGLVPQLAELFSDEQLQYILGDSKKKWILRSFSRGEMQRNNDPIAQYIITLPVNSISEEELMGEKNGRMRNRIGISEDFIQRQPLEWLHRFYKWLSETERRRKMARYKPYYLDQHGRAVAIYKNPLMDGTLNLFLPSQNLPSEVGEYHVVNEKLLENKDTAEFIKSLGVKEFSSCDYIYNYIIPQYEHRQKNDFWFGMRPPIDKHFMLFFECYCSLCMNNQKDTADYLEKIREVRFIRTYRKNSDSPGYNKGADIFFPTEDLKRYYQLILSTDFLALDYYESKVGVDKKCLLYEFIKALGVRDCVVLEKRKLSPEQILVKKEKKLLPSVEKSKNSQEEYIEPYIYGCEEMLDDIIEKHSKETSVVLWEMLCSLKLHNDNVNLEEGCVIYQHYKIYEATYEPEISRRLKTDKWLFDNKNNLVSAKDICAVDLADEYMSFFLKSAELIEFLGFKKMKSDEWLKGLTEEQRTLLAFQRLLKQQNISIEDLNDSEVLSGIKSLVTKNKGKKNSSDKLSAEMKEAAVTGMETDCDYGAEGSSLNGTTDSDQNIFLKKQKEYNRIIKRIKERSAKEINELEERKLMEEKIRNLKPYSFGWFIALLDLELRDVEYAGEKNQEMSISFSQAELEPNREWTIILKHPNCYIPQSIEEMSDIHLELYSQDAKRTINIEVVSIRSYTLRAKMKQPDELKGLDLAAITEASITVKDPIFLLEELKDNFSKLEYQDDYDMQENLPENIEFIFGPPGTGKTTYLANRVLLPKMEWAGLEHIRMKLTRILVLTPTNKAADVLVRKVMESDRRPNDYLKWLVRFGSTGDEEIEKSPVFTDKRLERKRLKRNITVVTTISRFLYDYFLVDDGRVLLKEIAWDYIIFDEASMIPLANIIYVIYGMKPDKFIIAGDPFQIEPIVNEDLWKGENIYKIVHLDSFSNPQTVPYKFRVELLTKQYRSVPSVGEMFSRFTYDGILEHNRLESERKLFHLEGDLLKCPLNIIQFPVSKYESIYHPKRLQNSDVSTVYMNQQNGGSPYQIYSAVFTFEYVCFLAKNIAEASPGVEVSIGIISPYRAQADLMDKLFATIKLPDDIDIQVGTVHGFQGDECDIMFVVFNPPPYIASSPEMFLNKQNIINVSISRARDYLFIVMPDKDTENIERMKKINDLSRLAQEIDGKTVPTRSKWLENRMFGQPNFLEKNVFSTGHQRVNVYALQENLYEVRTENTAVDIQIHRDIKGKKFGEVNKRDKN